MDISETQNKAIRYLAAVYVADESPSREGMASACGIGIEAAGRLFTLMEQLGYIETPVNPTGVALPAFLPSTRSRATIAAVEKLDDLDRQAGAPETPGARERRFPMATKIRIGAGILMTVLILFATSYKNQGIDEKKSPLAAATPTSLPTSKAEILAALEARRFELQPLELPEKTDGVTAYRLKEFRAAIVFVERGDALREFEIQLMLDDAKTNAESELGIAAISGEIATGLPRSEIAARIDAMIAELEKSSGGLESELGSGKLRVKLGAHRQADGRYIIKFTAAPEAGS